jgi:selenocysteine-specific translation elongation factor
VEGRICGVFGSNSEQKTTFLSSVGKKTETEGIVVYQRNESGMKYSLIDDATFPDKIQGYARVASICDYSFFLLPPGGKLSPSDGELAVLMDAFGLPGSVEVLDGTQSNVGSIVKSSFKGLCLSSYSIDERSSKSSVIDLSSVKPRKNLPERPLVYIDRAFNVKGVGLVVLGFLLSGNISVHDKLRLIPSDTEKFAEVKGIQISDEDYESTGRGIRVGLSLKGVELKDLSKVSWMDDGKLQVKSEVEFTFRQSPYYKQSTVDRDLHVEANGELLVTRISSGPSSDRRTAKLTSTIPVYEEMPISVLDLNAKPLRVCGGGTCVI